MWGRDAPVIKGLLEWTIHLTKCHGRQHSPIQSELELRQRGRRLPRVRTQPARCLLCSNEYHTGMGYSRHYNRRHKRMDCASTFFCPECKLQGHPEDVSINGHEEWMRHARKVHGIDAQRGVPMPSTDTPCKRKEYSVTLSTEVSSDGAASSSPSPSVGSLEPVRLERLAQEQELEVDMDVSFDAGQDGFVTCRFALC